MSRQSILDTRPDTPVFWRIEDINVEGSSSGKGVPVRLAGSVRNAVPPKKLIRYPDMALLGVRGDPVPAGSLYCADIKGSARRDLTPGTLLYPAWDEQFFSTRAVITSLGKMPAPGGAILAPDGLPSGLRTRNMAPISSLRPFGSAHLVTLARRFPLVPGSTVLLCDSSGRELARLTVQTTLPVLLDGGGDARTRNRKPPESPADVEPGGRAAAYRLFGFIGSPDESAAPACDAVRISWWWVQPDKLSALNALLVRSCRHHAGMGGRDLAARLVASVPGVGNAFCDALIAAATPSLLVKRERRLYPAGVEPEQLLPPAGRRFLEQLEQSGRVGVDLGKGAHSNTREIVESLDRLGQAVLLDNALVLSPKVLAGLAAEALEALRADRSDMHQRDLAALWGVPRNTARAVVLRLLRDGVLVRASSVHVRAGKRRRS